MDEPTPYCCRLCNAVFVLPWKINVFQNDGDGERSQHQGLKKAHSFVMTVLRMRRVCDRVAKMLLILINLFHDIINQGQVLDIIIQKKYHDFVWAPSVADTTNCSNSVSAMLELKQDYSNTIKTYNQCWFTTTLVQLESSIDMLSFVSHQTRYVTLTNRGFTPTPTYLFDI